MDAMHREYERERSNLRARVEALEADLNAAKQALEKAKPILRYHIHEPWRHEMDKQTEWAFDAVAHTLDRLN